MEMYTDSLDRRAFLKVPVTPLAGSLDVTIKKEGKPDYIVETVVAETDGSLSVTIPYYMSSEDGSVTILWEFDYDEGGTRRFSRAQTIDFVTPILPSAEIIRIADEYEEMTVDEINALERSVRYIINSHTGQSFGRSTGTKTIKASGGSYLKLPERLIHLTSVAGFPYLYRVSVTGGGWYLAIGNGTLVPPIRADFDGINSGSHHEGVIHIPDWMRRGHSLGFRNGQSYEVNGLWGWDSVPANVQEAARLLINDVASGDTIYRDRYLTSMTAADWRIQHHSGAFQHTGNARVDQLLSDYVLSRGWAVV